MSYIPHRFLQTLSTPGMPLNQFPPWRGWDGLIHSLGWCAFVTSSCGASWHDDWFLILYSRPRQTKLAPAGSLTIKIDGHVANLYTQPSSFLSTAANLLICDMSWTSVRWLPKWTRSHDGKPASLMGPGKAENLTFFVLPELNTWFFFGKRAVAWRDRQTQTK